MSYTLHRPLFLVTIGIFIGTLMQALSANAQDSTTNMSAVMDPGYNAQQEIIIYVCLITIAAMMAVVCLLLWFLVDRSKREIRAVKRILPEIVDKLRARAEIADEEDGQVVSGTMRAPEFEAGFMTSSSMADNSVDRYQTRYNQQRLVDRQQSWNSTTISSARDVSTREELTNHVGRSQPVQPERTSRFETRVAHDPTDRERNSFENEGGGPSGIVARPSNRVRGEITATHSPGNPQNALALGTFHQSETGMVDTRPELSARVDVSVLSARQARHTGPNSTYVYDNPDMFRGDHTQTNHTDIMTQPNDQNKLKYRNSYYESHV